MIRWVLAFWLLAVPARARDLIVLTAGAIRSVADAVTPSAGEKIVLRNDTAGALLRRIQAGEPFDVVLTSATALDALAGKIDPASRIDLARSGIGVGVRAGTPPPDIGTLTAFRTTLLGARTIAMIDPASGGSSGIYLVHLFQTMGIAEGLAPKLVLVNGGLAGAAVADGRADVVLQQMSEILAVPGVTLAGPLPAEVQNWTVYAGGVGAGSASPAEARAFLAALIAPEMRPLLTAKGLTPP